MIVPACIFLGINQHHPENYSGWAIPTATDIAFALGVLSLFRKKVPRTLFVLLAAIAIADDIGAVIVIALFYTQKLHLWALICSGLCVLILAILCMAKVRWLSIYGLIGAVLWVFLYQSGVHPSISGVLVAFMIPISREQQRSPLHILENRLHIPVNYGIVPLFIFFNAGVSFADLLPHSNLVTGIATFMHNPLVLGITLGLAIGKPLGIGGSILLLTQMKWASLPEGITRNYLFFMACLAGIGFTMAIFISDLAFPLQETLKNFAKAGILLGSITSIFVGVLSLLFGRKGS
jgi:NhaA family Na+:H+ antiporter